LFVIYCGVALYNYILLHNTAASVNLLIDHAHIQVHDVLQWKNHFQSQILSEIAQLSVLS